MGMVKGEDIEERLIEFAVTVTKLCDELPRTRTGNHFAGQLLRCGTTPAAHYAEARGAESRRDFIHKLRVALKELNETKVWLKIIERGGLLSEDRLHYAISECSELSRIINASITTARKN